MKVTEDERGWIGLMRLNRALSKREINRKWRIGRLQVTFNWRSKHNLMGRFGGGWNWEFGFQASSWRSIIFNLLVFSIRFYIPRRDSK